MQKQAQLSLFIVSLFLLSGCDFFNKSKKESTQPEASPQSVTNETDKTPQPKDSSNVLATIDGKPLLTEKQFEEYKRQFAQAQPNYAPFLNDPAIEEQVFEGQLNEKKLELWAKENNIAQKPEFKKDLEDIMDFGKRSLNVKYFQEAHPVTVSDADARGFYEENKQSPQFMMDAGGVKAQAVMFDSKDKAEKFFDEVKDKPTKFASEAKDEDLKVKDFGFVQKQSFNVEGPLREKILSYKSFPKVELVTINDKSYAVVYATEKKEAKFVDFEQVKEPIKNMLKQQKSAENMMQKMQELDTKYNVKKSDYFEQKKKAREDEQKKAAQAALENKQDTVTAQQESAKKPALQTA
jgi:peptidyl-prolyl cis-trans isomerase C